MTDNELLLAISDMMDKKLDARLAPIENEIRSDIKLLAENYVPAAKKYEKEAAKIEAMQADLEVMKKVIQEHSQKLQNIT